MTKLATNHGTSAAAWWERSVVKRSSSAVSDMVKTMTSESQFLQSRERLLAEQPVQLKRNQIQVGKLLGYGTFSYVHEVKGFDFTSAEEPENDQSDNSSSSLSSLAKQRLQHLSVNGGLAIKHLRQDLMKNTRNFEEAAADLIMEAKYLAALDHPNIVKLRAVAKGGVSAFESGQHDGFFVITDKLQGSLKDKIFEWQFLNHDSSGIPVPSCDEASSPASSLLLEKINLAKQLAEALAYLHKHRLVYRDLKPHNVGIKDDSTVQLFDFGFCRQLPEYASSYNERGQPKDDNELYCMSGKGSLMYLAPEVLLRGRYNQKADVYSFAMVFYEILTLNKPFPSTASAEAHRDLVGKWGVRPPLEHTNIPMPVQRLLRDAWDGSIAKRLTMREVCRRLEQLPTELELENNVSSKADRSQPRADIFCGAFWDHVFSFASDLQCGYKVLTKATPIPVSKYELQEDSSNSLIFPEDTTEDQSALPEDEELKGNTTDDTIDSSVFSAASLYLNPIADESKQMSLQEARSALTIQDEQEGENETTDDRDTSAEEEIRCPASPLARTTSSPQARRKSLPGKDVPEPQRPVSNNVPALALARTASSPQVRRSSMPGKEVLDPQWPASMEVPLFIMHQ